MEKQCFKCKEKKSLSEFYVHKAMACGHLGKCKTCTKRDVQERLSKVKQNPKWLAAERERCRKKQSYYRSAGLDCKSGIDVKERWNKRNPEKRSAQLMAASALKSGKIVRKYFCESCGCGGSLEKHHEDYSKPLEIIWLCRTCHGKTRRKK